MYRSRSGRSCWRRPSQRPPRQTRGRSSGRMPSRAHRRRAAGIRSRPGTRGPTPGVRSRGVQLEPVESWIAVKPGTEDLVGTSKFFFETFSTFYNFHLGSYRMLEAHLSTTTRSRATTASRRAPRDAPELDRQHRSQRRFRHKGRAYQVTLPFNAYWERLHPNAAVDISYCDDMGRHWIRGNGGGRSSRRRTRRACSSVMSRTSNGWRSTTSPATATGPRVRGVGRLQRLGDEGPNGGLPRSRPDLRRGRDDQRPVRGRPGATSSIRPSTLRVTSTSRSSRSRRAGRPSRSTSLGPPTTVEPSGRSSRSPTVGVLPTAGLPNTTFRDGIAESFAASPTIRVTSTSRTRTGTAPSSTCSSPSRPTAARTGRPRSW